MNKPTPTLEFIRKECLRQLGIVSNGLNIELLKPKLKLDDGRDHWIGSISFELMEQCFWRLNIRFTTREARILTAHATGINPSLLTIPVIHSCIKEMLNTIAGPIKHAAQVSLSNNSLASFRPMLPRVDPA